MTTVTCPDCHGTGRLDVVRDGPVFPRRATCGRCAGSGAVNPVATTERFFDPPPPEGWARREVHVDARWWPASDAAPEGWNHE